MTQTCLRLRSMLLLSALVAAVGFVPSMTVVYDGDQ